MPSLRKFSVALLCSFSVGLAFSVAHAAETRPETNKISLDNLALRLQQKFLAGRGPLYQQLLHSTDPAQKALNDNPDIELMYVDEKGLPHFYTTDNLDAARTISTDDVWPGGSGGYSLSGSGTTLGKLGIWDGGAVLTTHQEFGGRVTQMDGGATHYHSTHVAGTMVAKGQVAAAKGMSYEANLAAYNWTNDDSEMASAAAAGMNVSNHSYGYATGWTLSGSWYWYGDMSVSTVEDYMFGFYDDHTRDWDQIAYDAPYYTIVIAAGNDRDDNATGGHYHWDGGWVWATDYHDPDGGSDGYDCLGSPSGAKNAMIVGAVRDITGGYSQPSDVILTSFSSWGPTDDGRIKPDIVANGYQLYSCTNTGNSDYIYLSGTSMATPNCSGSLNLLVRHYEATHGGATPLSSTMKAVVIQTADEAGSYTGPDYMFGWGLMNTLHSADVISDDASRPIIIDEDYLADVPGGDVDTLYFYSSGVDPLRLTLAWTDPPGTPPAPSLNPTTLMLVNDLDLRVKHLGTSTTYYPYVLDPSNPANAATTGDNYRDNVEQIYVASPPAGNYIVTISHKGNLTADQWYSLVSSVPMDANGPDTTPPTITVTSPNGGESWKGNDVEDITWTASDAHGVDSVSIYYSINGGTSYNLIASGEPNDGVYPWTVPEAPNDSALVKVVAYDPSLNQNEDTSDDLFTMTTGITPPLVTVSAPDGGETWYAGDPHDVAWEALNPTFGAPATDDFTDGDDAGWTHYCYSATCNWTVSGGVYHLTASPGPTISTFDATDTWSNYEYDVDVRTDTGTNRTVIFRYVDPDNYYDLLMRPARLVLTRHTSVSDTTLGTAPGLSFSAGVWYGITILALNGDIQVYVDGDRLIDVVDPDPLLSGPVGVRAESGEEALFDNVSVTQLSGLGLIESVDICYSTDGGSTFPDTIATGLPNDSPHEWIVTGPASTQAVVKVIASDRYMHSGEDTSDAYFTIAVVDTTDPDVAVLTPNGGETWFGKDNEDITWTATDANGVDSVSIFYSLDNGSVYHLISSGEANDGTYTWLIPDTFSVEAMVKVMAYDPSLNTGEDESDAVFTIADDTGPVVDVLTPDGGEFIQVWSDYNITWTATDPSGVDSVSIFYSVNGGDTYELIASDEGNDGTYSWSVPNVLTDSALVKIIAYDHNVNAAAGESDSLFTIWSGTTDSPGGQAHLGDAILLWQNSPNPFAPGTHISFYLPKESTVRLEVFDAKGRLVDVLIDGRACPAGVHTVPWNGEGRAGGRVSSGVYFYRFRAGNVTLVKKMVMTQ
jgi:hypothetical protein